MQIGSPLRPGAVFWIAVVLLCLLVVSPAAGAVWESPVDTFSKILYGGKIPSNWGGVQGHSPVALDDGTVLVVTTSPQRTSWVSLSPMDSAYRFDPRGVELYKGNSSKESYLEQSYHAFSGWDLVVSGWVSSWYTYSDPYSPRGISIADGSYVFIDTIPYARAYMWSSDYAGGGDWYGYQPKNGNSWWANIAPSGALISSKSHTGFVLRDIYERADGTFLAVAQKDISTQNPCAAGMVLSLSSTGEVISSRILYPGEYVGSDLYRLSPVPGTGGQEFWVIGYRYKDSAINAELIPLVLRIDSEGNTLSEYIYESIGSLPKEPPSFHYQVHPAVADFPRTAVPQIRSTDDGGAVWTYTTVAPEGNIQSVLIKITPAGVIEWSKSYPAVYEGGNCQIAGVCPRGGGYLLLLKDGTYFRVAQTDSSGTILSDVAWGTDSGGVTVPYDLAVRGDAYIVSGGVSRPDLGSQGFVVVGESTDEARVDGPRPKVSFSATPVSGAVPLTVSFTDTSTPSASWVVAPLKVFNSTTQILAWHWDFGDGNTSTDQNPTHTYTEPGLYTVTLTVTNAYGSTTLTREDLIAVAVNGPIYVATYADLCKVGTGVDGWTLDADYIQIADIQCPGEEDFPIIGRDEIFKGSYDGGNHTIRGLSITSSDYSVGMFSSIGGGATLKNIKLDNCNVSGIDNVGGLSGFSYGATVTNCGITGLVQGEDTIGGLIGLAVADPLYISNCIAEINVSGSRNLGGIVGQLNAQNSLIDNCSVTGSIEGTGACIGGITGSHYSGCLIRNCTASEVIIIGYSGAIGGISGEAYGGITDGCYVSGTIRGEGTASAGGLIGFNAQNAYVKNSTTSVTVTGGGIVGGLIGQNSGGPVDNCHVSGSVATSGNYDPAGGLVGYSNAGASNCTASGSVAGNGGPIGGLIGGAYEGTYFQCSASGAVTNMGEGPTGGLFGQLRGSATECYATGPVTGVSFCGGFVGGCWGGSITDCYATGSVTADGGHHIGGFAGEGSQSIVNCYSTGLVTATNVPDDLIEYLGGFSGGGDVPSSCFWNTETSGQAASTGGAVGKTTAEMKTIATFAGWNIATPAEYTDEVWFIVEGEDYPRLAWQGLPAPEEPTPTATSGTLPGPLPVRFVVQTYAGQPLANITVTATPLESTGPWAWLYDLFGISGDADLNGTVLAGTTDTGGGIVFSLIQTVKYRVTVTDASRGIDTSITLYPQEDAVVISVWPQEPVGSAGDFTLYAEEEAAGTRVGVRYATVDLVRVTFTVTTEAGEIVHQGTSVAQGDDLSYLLDGEPGEVYLYGYVAELKTGEVVRQDQYIRFAPESRPWIDLAPWIPLAAYHWASVFILVGFAMTFVRGEIRGALLTIPILSGILWLIGWLQVPWLLIGAVLVIGVLVYMRMGESDLGF